MARQATAGDSTLQVFGLNARKTIPLKRAISLGCIGAGMLASGVSARERCGQPNQHFEFEMSASQQHMILSKAASMPIGSTLAQAIAALGKPDDDDILASKQTPSRFIDHELTWYVARVERTAVYDQDRYVVLHFSKGGALTQTTYNCLKAVAGN